MKYSSNFKIEYIKNIARLCGPVVFFVYIFIPLNYAKAGFFGLTEKVVAGSVESMPIMITQTSQNIPILEASLSPDPSLALKSDEVFVVTENSLDTETGPVGTTADLLNYKVPGEISTYVVKKGDTLGEIAKMFDISVNTIIYANNLGRAGVIKEGQMLIILPISGIRHVVSKGDTISTIVSKYKADLEEVLIYNDLRKDSLLALGDEIIVPDVDLPGSIPLVSNKTAVTKGTSKYLGGGGPNYSGYYSRPVIGGVRSQGLHGWNGIDIAIPIGTPIYASAFGVVTVSYEGGWGGGYGNYVVITHPNGTQTLYGHNNKNLVKVGQKVERGDLIAYSGNTGKSTGPHLHYEVRGAKNPF